MLYMCYLIIMAGHNIKKKGWRSFGFFLSFLGMSRLRISPLGSPSPKQPKTALLRANGHC